MSIYLSDGGEKQEQIASNAGWGQFGDWADGLDAKEYSAVVALWEHGIVEDVDILTSQLKGAREASKPIADVAGIIDGILKASEGAEMVLVTDGTQPDNSETKAIDPLDTEREWSDEELEEFTETDVKFALGSSTPGMRELLRANPNEVNE